MIREIMRDEAFLAQKAEPATQADLSVAQDLLDTLEANKGRCVGMAANMIGVSKRIIVFDNEGTYMVMFNPEIIKRSGPIRRRRGACPFRVPGRRNAGSPSRYAIRMRNFRNGSRPSPAGQRRSSSTR